MNLVSLLQNCDRQGIQFSFADGLITIQGSKQAVDACRPVLQQHKEALTQHFRQAAQSDMVREYVEVDGLSLEQAQVLAALSIPIPPRTKIQAMIAELDSLIERYCTLKALSRENRAGLLARRRQQAAASIPASIAWFQEKIAVMERCQT